jgi:light-regulated signal transduction histidine kinase (bacteriophytochrome)
LEDLGSFSYSVAHDLRSPLKNIAALTEHLHVHAQEQNDIEAEAFTKRIAKGARRMIDLVDDLLRFSQTNTRELEPRQMDLPILFGDVIADQVPEDRRGQITVNIPPGTEVLGDAPMLKVVLHNLLSNALKFSRTHDAPAISISHLQENDRDVISVRDNGVGFDPQHSEQIFGAFKRLHQPEQFEGTGVGLAIVQRIVTKHGGQVWAESEVGQGTTIHFALPRKHASSRSIPFALAS